MSMLRRLPLHDPERPSDQEQEAGWTPNCFALVDLIPTRGWPAEQDSTASSPSRVSFFRYAVTRCLLAVLLASIMPACSADDDDDATSVVQAEINWTHPACDAGALEPPSGDPQACSGSWIYSYLEFWRDHNACGDSSVCMVHSSCTSWDLNSPGDGLGYTATSSSQIIHGTEICDWSTGCSGSSSHSFCPAKAAELRASLIASRPGISQPALNGFTVTWQVINENHTEYGCGPSDQGCQRIDEYDCLLHINNFPTMMTGVRNACPCEKFQAAECLRSGSILTSTEAPETIPDNDPNGTSSTITVPAGFVIDRVFVSADITHTYRGNLEISIVAPNGEVAMLSNREGGATIEISRLPR
jgi:hypothetical protein